MTTFFLSVRLARDDPYTNRPAPTSAHQDGSAAYVVAYTHTGEGRLITKDDHLRLAWWRARRNAEIEGSILRAIIMALSTGPLNIVASLGPGPALIAGGVAGIVQVLGEAAAAADGRRQIVAEGFAQMEPGEVEEWLHRDTRNLTLAVQAVIRATAAFDQQKIDALGRAFRTGVTDSARVDESLLVVLALGALERPHIDVLHVIAYEEPPLWSEQHGKADESQDAPSRTWFIAGLMRRLPHLSDVMQVLELTLRTSGITSRTEGAYGGVISDVQLTPLGRLCVDYLSAAPASTADAAE